MNRFGAFAIHLGISLLIFIVLGYLIVFHWYPDFFFTTDGGWQGIRIIALVDLVLGPLLTLCVFKQGKPGLRTDLTLIGVFQLCCLSAGTYVVYSERPIAIVYTDGYFHSMSRGSYLDKDTQPPDLEQIPGPAPKWVAVDLPSDPHEQGEIRMSAWQAGKPLTLLVDRYTPLSIDTLDFAADAYPLDRLQGHNRQAAIAKWLADHGGALEDYAFFPLGTRYSYSFIGVKKSSREILGVLDTPLNAGQTANAS